MNRLAHQRQRLALPAPGADDATQDPRVLALELARPADWDLLGRVWRGAQADLGLPAPGIAVNGSDGFQLWFPLAAGVPRADAEAFLQGLCDRYLAEVAPRRLRRLPGANGPTLPHVPERQGEDDRWSAFVAPDLAPVFVDTPWLDVPPSEEGQADRLAALVPITPDRWQAALEQLTPPQPATAPAAPSPQTDCAPSSSTDPRQFLLEVMNDGRVEMALRIEAARVLLSDDATRSGHCSQP